MQAMKRHNRVWMGSRCGLAAAVLLALALGTGCDESGGDYSIVPPAGLGTLVVENNTASDIDLYLDGLSRGQVGDDSYRPVELTPGVYRVVLDEEDGDRQYGADIDILEGRLTILHVYLAAGDYMQYRVRTEFQ